MVQEFRQRKSLSQVFLKESWPCARVAGLIHQAGIQEVLEIGPGAGIMTVELLRAGLNVTAIEKDSRLIDPLIDLARYTRELHPDAGELKVINQDILRFDLAEWTQSTPSKPALAGNIPYNISSPIVLWLLPHIAKVSVAYLLVQLEFALRLAAQSGNKDFGSITVFAQLRAHINLEFKVNRQLFKPVPKVDSAMISLTHNKANYAQELLDITEKLTRLSFMQRRKKLRNSIKTLVKEFQESDFPVDLDRRAETLSPDEFIACGKFLLDHPT